jgi:hypothetical protein
MLSLGSLVARSGRSDTVVLCPPLVGFARQSLKIGIKRTGCDPLHTSNDAFDVNGGLLSIAPKASRPRSWSVSGAESLAP